MDYAIGIDLGGTNIKAAAVTEGGELLAQSSCATRADAEGRWRENVRAQVELLEGRVGRPARWRGMASPGLVARDGRSIAMVTTKLPGLRGLDWTEFLESDSTVVMINDAHAALLAEVWKGAAKGSRHAVLLTLGTGVGGAVFADGRLLKGAWGKAGHMGHMSLDVNAKADAQGIPGSLEDAVGNATVADRTGGRFTETRDLVRAHLDGDPFATEVWLRSVHHLACAMASLINILDPEVFILGGGISRAGRALLDPLAGYLKEMEWSLPSQTVAVTTVEAGEFAGALGAAYNAMRAASSAASRVVSEPERLTSL